MTPSSTRGAEYTVQHPHSKAQRWGGKTFLAEAIIVLFFIAMEQCGHLALLMIEVNVVWVIRQFIQGYNKSELKQIGRIYQLRASGHFLMQLSMMGHCGHGDTMVTDSSVLGQRQIGMHHNK
jgi:hypothetical protein